MSIQRKRVLIVAAIVIIVLSLMINWKYSANKADIASAKIQPQKGVPILMYHKVDPYPWSGGLGLRVPPNDFNWQMRYLKENGYHAIDLGAVIDHFQKGEKLPAKPIVITFDDGYQDNYRYAYPILKKYGFTATIFVVTNTVGGFNKFDYIVHLEPKVPMLTWGEIKEMNHNGITIGAHTLDHVHLTKVSPKEAKRQISESKKLLEHRLGKNVQYFCYPYGDYNQAVEKLVKASGYKAATNTKPGFANARSNPYLLHRVRITGHLNHQGFVKQLHSY